MSWIIVRADHPEDFNRLERDDSLPTFDVGNTDRAGNPIRARRQDTLTPLPPHPDTMRVRHRRIDRIVQINVSDSGRA
jgi:hypothetical protein